jgi:hypothetical protein
LAAGFRPVLGRVIALGKDAGTLFAPTRTGIYTNQPEILECSEILQEGNPSTVYDLIDDLSQRVVRYIFLFFGAGGFPPALIPSTTQNRLLPRQNALVV